MLRDDVPVAMSARERQVPESLTHMNNELNRLSSTVDDLLLRIQPVFHSDETEAKASNGCRPRPAGLCEVADCVHKDADRIADIADKLTFALQRLEL